MFSIIFKGIQAVLESKYLNRYFKINDFLADIYLKYKEMAGSIVQSIMKSNFAKWTREINLNEYRVDDAILGMLLANPIFEKLKVLKLAELNSLTEASI